MTFALLTSLSALLAVLVLLFRQLAVVRRRPRVPQDWTPDLAFDRYRPMFRLLDSDEVRFLSSQPGSTPALVARFRRQRCELFRGYLRSLERDFQMASDALVMVMVQSPIDRRDLVRALVASRLKFTLGVVRVRCRLLCYRWNVGAESVANLVGLFEGLQLELMALTPATAASVS